MPVWHESTKQWRKEGRLQVIGITQEQHPDRCRLFAQWKGIDFPVLWDPFNLTGSPVVPRFILIDEHGVVRSLRANPRTIEAEFLDNAFDKPDGKAPIVPDDPPNKVVQLDGRHVKSMMANAWRAVSNLLWQEDVDWKRALESMAWAAERRPAMRFRLGVAHRIRYDDRTARRPEDFQAAINAWADALSKDPRQYIWRRRIQQYGPRLDKPYPFFSWIEQATEEIAKRGDAPVPVEVALTASERAGRSPVSPDTASEEPDPRRQIEAGAVPVVMESAVAPNTGRGKKTICIHLMLRPPPGRPFWKWDFEAGTPVVWLGGRLVRPSNVKRAHLDGGVRFELDLEDPGTAIEGYALYYACLSEHGECRYLRHDFEVNR